jgi:hypothetical protein
LNTFSVKVEVTGAIFQQPDVKVKALFELKHIGIEAEIDEEEICLALEQLVRQTYDVNPYSGESTVLSFEKGTVEELV